MQEITNWSDPAIQGLNPDVSLPDLEIVVITRQGGSGSTFILTQYLSDMHDAWGAQIGTNSSLDLLNTLQAKTTTHMGKLISQIPGSIGYLAYNYGADFSLKFAAIENKSGNFITPNTASVSESANTEIPADARVFCTGTMAKNGYPLSSFSWLILYQEQSYNNRTKKEAKALKKFLKYIVKNGNNYYLNAEKAIINQNIEDKRIIPDLLKSVLKKNTIELYANSIEYLANYKGDINTDFLIQKVVIKNTSIPVIISDKYDNIIDSKNILKKIK